MKLVISTSALIGRRPIEVRRFCSHSGEGPFLTPRTSRSAKPGHSVASSTVTLHRAGEFALDLLDAGVFELAHVGGGKIARDAVHAGAVLPVRRQIDFDHGIAEAGPLRVGRADGRIGRQLHDAVMVFGNLQLGRRAQHAAALDASDRADAKRDVLAGNEGAGRREHADETSTRVRRAADHLHRCAQAALRRCRPCRPAADPRSDAARRKSPAQSRTAKAPSPCPRYARPRARSW